MNKVKIFAALTGVLSLGFIAGRVTNKKESPKKESKDIYVGNLVVDNNDAENGLPNIYLEFLIQPEEMMKLNEAKIRIKTVGNVSH